MSTINVSNQTHEFLYTKEVLVGNCEEVEFTITATNSIGTSYSSTPMRRELPLGM